MIGIIVQEYYDVQKIKFNLKANGEYYIDHSPETLGYDV